MDWCNRGIGTRSYYGGCRGRLLPKIVSSLLPPSISNSMAWKMTMVALDHLLALPWTGATRRSMDMRWPLWRSICKGLKVIWIVVLGTMDNKQFPSEVGENGSKCPEPFTRTIEPTDVTCEPAKMRTKLVEPKSKSVNQRLKPPNWTLNHLKEPRLNRG